VSLPRNTSLTVLAGPTTFPIAADMVALELQDPSYAGPAFTNATGNGMDRWRTLDYAGLAHTYRQGLALQSSFSDINTDDPDLSGVRDRGVKVLSYHGLADDFIPVQGSINYFTRAAAAMGGVPKLQGFQSPVPHSRTGARLDLLPRGLDRPHHGPTDQRRQGAAAAAVHRPRRTVHGPANVGGATSGPQPHRPRLGQRERHPADLPVPAEGDLPP